MRCVLLLNRMTGWGLEELLALTWDELEGWLKEAAVLERELAPR